MESKINLSPISRIGKDIERWLFPASLFQTILLLLVAFAAVFSISEIAARESVLSLLTGQITVLKSEFVEQNRNWSVSTATLSTQPEGAYPVEIAEKDRRILLQEIRRLEFMKRSLQTLIALGSDSPNFSLRMIQNQLNEIFATSKNATVQASAISTFILENSERLLLLSSDLLLAIAIMACGSIGAMITTLRGNGGMTLRALSLGLASGFVVYLAIKGGKHVFLLQTQGELVAFNPYGTAFAGLLAGLFTERVHQILSVIVDDFAERLKAASSGGKSPD